MSDVAITPESLVREQHKEIVNMVAYEKINTMLSPSLSLFGNTMTIVNIMDCVPRVHHVWRKRNTIHMYGQAKYNDDGRFTCTHNKCAVVQLTSVYKCYA